MEAIAYVEAFWDSCLRRLSGLEAGKHKGATRDVRCRYPHVCRPECRSAHRAS
jgi:hypothetical protein